MKRTTPRKTSKKPLHSAGAAFNRSPDEPVLADLRVSRDDSGFMITQINTHVNDEDAIDRLLANSGFDNPLADNALQPLLAPAGASPGLMSAVDDFEPDRAMAYVVGPIAQDPHLKVQVQVATDSDDARFKAGQNDHDGNPSTVGTLAGDDLGQDNFFAEARFNRASDECVDHGEVGVLTSPAYRPAQTECFQTRSRAKIEPAIVDIPVHNAEAVHIDRVIEPRQAVDLVDDGPDNGSLTDAGTGHGQEMPATPSAQRQAEDNRQPPHRCEYQTEQARINLITLILSIVASLSTLVFYFMLMDMRGDLAKLNEMVDIMKEDSQMIREEPPVEQ